ncbi:hypothetical protein RA307_09300 [Xanthobacteraceae bacterium Astr-EGSB]|uniref:hypothetical protein n=1 Tax=Astrobacterium formosum TaxID=3069710 RepID=UPI0027B44FF0|nr:hypothetical protein [Xanthobacteraceae bacterium Astr-EGSB]
MIVASLTQAFYSFALMAFIAVMCAGVIKLIVTVLARSAQPAQPKPAASANPAPAPSVASATAAAPDVITDELAIIIAAACDAVIGAHRIVYVAEASRPANWTSEMRARHHLSHFPHR